MPESQAPEQVLAQHWLLLLTRTKPNKRENPNTFREIYPVHEILTGFTHYWKNVGENIRGIETGSGCVLQIIDW